MRTRVGLHDSDVDAVALDEDPVRVVFHEPERVVGVLVDGVVPSRARARAPNGDWFELEGEPLAELGGARLVRETLLTSELELQEPDPGVIEIHVDYEVHALREFARGHGLDFQALAYGRESFDQFHGYRILGTGPEEQPQRVEAVAISRPAGRFGNNLMQLVRATHVARELGVDTIYVPPMSWFEAGPLPTSAGGITYVDYSDVEDIAVPSLFATFLFEDLEPAVSTLDGDQRQRLVDRYVSRLFTPPPLGEPRPMSHVAVHLRSGDLFDRPNPHPNFVQPPLAFYVAALRHFAEGRLDVHVMLVYEDEGNPVIPALQTFLRSAGMPYSVSTSSLAADLVTLLEHRALVLGRGSLGVAVAALSTRVETLYFPWSEARFAGLVREAGLDGYLIDEIVPRYIEAGEWTNSVEQRRLMIEYPTNNLRLTKRPRRTPVSG